jgi:hypothetical protein
VACLDQKLVTTAACFLYCTIEFILPFSPSVFLHYAKTVNFIGTTSNPARRRGPTMTRSIVLEAINVGQGSELSVAQVFLVPMHLYIFSYCVPLVDI